MDKSIALVALACALIGALACGRGPDDPVDDATGLASCGVDGNAALTGDGVGALRIGATVERVVLACRVVSDTTDPRGPEGMSERSLTVSLGDRADTVRAVVTGDSILRLHVTAEWLRTGDSLGVGSRLGTLRARPGARLDRGEGRLFVTMRDPCGLSFRLDRPDTSANVSLASLDDSARVAEVLVVGCR